MNVVGRFAEKKYWDVKHSIGSSEWPAEGIMVDLCSVPQDVTDKSRIGDKLMMSSIEMRLITYTINDFEPTETDGFMRFIIFKWFDDTIPTRDDILDAASGPPFAVIAPFNHDKKVKRKILVDRTLTYTWYATKNQIHGTAKHIRVYIDMKKRSKRMRQIDYQGGSTVGVGKVYVLLVSNIPTPYTPGNCTLGYNFFTRMNFTDV